MNFLIDSVVFLLAAKTLKLPNLKNIYKKSIWKIRGFGFLADIIGAIFLFLSNYIKDRLELPDAFLVGVNYNPRGHRVSMLWTIIALLISGFLIFYFNYRWSLSEANLSDQDKRKLALRLAIFTAPYIFLVSLSRFGR
ncbi:MAG: hypothetical protein HG424_000470 [candidate division SR1 bacterium]|nr:hypothetical protein [candidate division SR1 bacterium]